MLGSFANDAKVTVTLQEIIQIHVPEDARAARTARAEASAPTPVGASNTTPMPMFVMQALLPITNDSALQLLIFEPRYRLLVRRVMESSRKFGMMGPRDASATEVVIVRCDTLIDGRFHITIVPTGRRLKVVSRTVDESGYLVGHGWDLIDASDEIARKYVKRAKEIYDESFEGAAQTGSDDPSLDLIANAFLSRLFAWDRNGTRSPESSREFVRDVFSAASSAAAASPEARPESIHPEPVSVWDLPIETLATRVHECALDCRAVFLEMAERGIRRGGRNATALLGNVPGRDLGAFAWSLCAALTQLGDTGGVGESGGWEPMYGHAFIAACVGTESLRERLVLCRAALLRVARTPSAAEPARREEAADDFDEDDETDNEEDPRGM
jgi:hypothetical protein